MLANADSDPDPHENNVSSKACASIVNNLVTARITVKKRRGIMLSSDVPHMLKPINHDCSTQLVRFSTPHSNAPSRNTHSSETTTCSIRFVLWRVVLSREK